MPLVLRSWWEVLVVGHKSWSLARPSTQTSIPFNPYCAQPSAVCSRELLQGLACTHPLWASTPSTHTDNQPPSGLHLNLTVHGPWSAQWQLGVLFLLNFHNCSTTWEASLGIVVLIYNVSLKKCPIGTLTPHGSVGQDVPTLPPYVAFNFSFLFKDSGTESCIGSQNMLFSVAACLSVLK